MILTLQVLLKNGLPFQFFPFPIAVLISPVLVRHGTAGNHIHCVKFEGLDKTKEEDFGLDSLFTAQPVRIHSLPGSA